jgi:CRP/FNR family transcriptional regulator
LLYRAQYSGLDTFSLHFQGRALVQLAKDATAAARRSEWLSAQPEGFCEGVCSRLQTMRLKRLESLFHAEDDSPSIYFLAEGSMVALLPHPIGSLMPGECYHPGDWFGIPAAFGRRPRLATTQARRDSTVLKLRLADLWNIAGSSAAFAQCVPNLLAGYSESLVLAGRDLLTPDFRLRLFSRLLTLAGRRIDRLPPAGVIIPFSQEELALTSNMSRQRVHEILAELSKEGICELGYGHVILRDPKALAQHFL